MPKPFVWIFERPELIPYCLAIIASIAVAYYMLFGGWDRYIDGSIDDDDDERL